MPGMIYHLAFAEEIFRHMKGTTKEKVQFFSGNLIPDLAMDKEKSHYKVPASFSGFKVPDMDKVKRDLYDKTNLIKFGMYCHLYLDYYFIEEFLITEFDFNKSQNIVTNCQTGKAWDKDEFFAKATEGGILYSGYSSINKLMIADGHVDMSIVDMLSDNLPLTGIKVFDERRKKTWREELDVYLSTNIPYTGEILNYEQLWNKISRIAERFIAEEL